VRRHLRVIETLLGLLGLGACLSLMALLLAFVVGGGVYLAVRLAFGGLF